MSSKAKRQAQGSSGRSRYYAAEKEQRARMRERINELSDMVIKKKDDGAKPDIPQILQAACDFIIANKNCKVEEPKRAKSSISTDQFPSSSEDSANNVLKSDGLYAEGNLQKNRKVTEFLTQFGLTESEMSTEKSDSVVGDTNAIRSSCLVNNFEECFMILDARKKKVSYANDKTGVYLNMPIELINGKRIRNFIYSGDLKALNKHFDKCISNGLNRKSMAISCRMINKLYFAFKTKLLSHEDVYFKAPAEILYVDNQKPLYILMIGRRHTNILQFDLLEGTAVNFPEWSITKLDLEGTITYATPVVKSMFGYEAKDLVGIAMSYFYHADDTLRVNVASRRFILDAITFITAKKKKRKNGERFEEMPLVFRIRNSQHRHVWVKTYFSLHFQSAEEMPDTIMCRTAVAEELEVRVLCAEMDEDNANGDGGGVEGVMNNASYDILSPMNPLVYKSLLETI
eukprot:Nk52_evm27s311 gene=Nk52_evmTU27s311